MNRKNTKFYISTRLVTPDIFIGLCVAFRIADVSFTYIPSKEIIRFTTSKPLEAISHYCFLHAMYS